MAFEINSDKYSFASKPQKSETDYTLTIARQLVSKEAEARASADTEINRHLNLLDNSEADFRAFEALTTAELAEKEVLSNKVQSISTAPSQDKYPSEAAVAEYVAGLGEGNGGHVHPNKEVIDTITHERINRWDYAADNLKDYSVEAMASAVNNLIDKTNTEAEKLSKLEEETTLISEKVEELSVLPAGVICMWSGSVIPDGWALCNGESGTPDLRDRFVIGSGGNYSTGDTGGNDSIDISHTHEYSGTTDGSVYYDKSTNSGNTYYATHRHTHTYGGTTYSSGGIHSILPPYFALAYIMKL